MSHVQLFEASTSYQVMVLAAAIDSGLFAEADERVLLVSVNTPVPEVATRPDRAPGMAPLLSRFDRVVSLNDLLAPLHPTAFRPRGSEQPLFERLLRAALGIDERSTLELAVESVQAPPSRSLLNVFATAEVTVYAEGLMSYGPTRDPLPVHAASRIRRLLHLDLIGGLRPLLLTEWEVKAVAIPDDAFRAVVGEVLAAAPPRRPEAPYALVLGQYLAQVGLLSRARETALYADLVRTAAAEGFRTVAFKPHPSAPADAVEAVERAVRDVDVRLEVLRDPTPVEALYAADPPGLLLGCFSTGLVTGARYWGIRAVTSGIGDVLAALPRFEDSNRIPLALVERAFPGPDGAQADVDTLQAVVSTVGYCMQWRTRGRWRPEAEAALRERPELFTRTVPPAKRRLLGLPGGLPVAVPPELFERASGTAERLWTFRTAVRARIGI